MIPLSIIISALFLIVIPVIMYYEWTTTKQWGWLFIFALLFIINLLQVIAYIVK